MAWEKRTVTDQNVEFPNRFKIDGVSKTIEPDFGTVVDAGTPINKAYLQPIEDFLEELDDRQGTHEAKDATTSQKGHVQLGNTSDKASPGNHNHDGVYEPANAYIMKRNVAQTMTANLVAKTGTDYSTKRVRNIYAGTADLTPGTSALDSGTIYIVYE